MNQVRKPPTKFARVFGYISTGTIGFVLISTILIKWYQYIVMPLFASSCQ